MKKKQHDLTGYVSEAEAASMLGLLPSTLARYRNDHIGGWIYRAGKVKVDTKGRTVRRGIKWSVHYLQTEFFKSADAA